MNTLGIVLTIVVGIFVSIIILLSLYEYIWNKRLKKYQAQNNTVRLPKKFYQLSVRRLLVGLTSVVILTVFIATGAFNLPVVYQNKTLVNAQVAGNEHTLRNKLDRGNGFSWDGFFTGDAKADGSFDLDATSGESGSTPDVVGTNIQVEGVDEADIIKTDGYELFYSPKYNSNRIYKYRVEANGSLTKLDGLTFEDFLVEEFYLTDTLLIVIGKTYEELLNYHNSANDTLILPAYYHYRVFYNANIRIYDRDSLTLNYELKTESYIRTHRLIDDHLYIVSNNNVSHEELRPTFIENIGEKLNTIHVNYENILIFDKVPAYQILTISAINILTYEAVHESYAGVADIIYMTKDAIYLAGNYSYFSLLEPTLSGTHIVKFNIDSTLGTVQYAASVSLKGFVYNQFWMDDYEGHLRVVTTLNGNGPNRLYMLKENPENDKLDVVGVLEEGIGKPGERVMSARFDKHTAYVVTFRQTDPLYTIDVTNPKKIEILNEIEEPGYSAYLHVWDETHLVGIGYESPVVKLSVYQANNSTSPLETYHLGKEIESGYTWSYSEALNNHKAILISPEHGFVGFAANKSYYDMTLQRYMYTSVYYIFYLDFNNDPIIAEPILVEHQSTSYSNQIDGAVFINNIFYTFSSESIVTFNSETKTFGSTYVLKDDQ